MGLFNFSKTIKKLFNISQKRSKMIFIIVSYLFVLMTIYICYTATINEFILNYVEFVRVNIFSTMKSPRICCLILTNPNNLLTRARAVHETWAPRCDRYFFISENFTNHEKITAKQAEIIKQLPILPIGNIPHGRQYLTGKVYIAFLAVYEQYLYDFDWFIKADDDTYIIVDNLRTFLAKQSAFEPVTFGYNFKTNVYGEYHSGGAAYVLSRESLKRFYKAHLLSYNTDCWWGGSEDVAIAKCLRSQGVHVGTSIDEHGREAFHPLPFLNHFSGSFPKWMHSYAANPLRTHYNCCSERMISFHYISPVDQYYLDYLLYRLHF